MQDDLSPKQRTVLKRLVEGNPIPARELQPYTLHRLKRLGYIRDARSHELGDYVLVREGRDRAESPSGTTEVNDA